MYEGGKFYCWSCMIRKFVSLLESVTLRNIVIASSILL